MNNSGERGEPQPLNMNVCENGPQESVHVTKKEKHKYSHLPPPALIRSASVGYLSIKLPASHKGSTISLEQAGSVLFVKYPNNLKAPQEHQTAPRVLSYTL